MLGQLYSLIRPTPEPSRAYREYVGILINTYGTEDLADDDLIQLTAQGAKSLDDLVRPVLKACRKRLGREVHVGLAPTTKARARTIPTSGNTAVVLISSGWLIAIADYCDLLVRQADYGLAGQPPPDRLSDEEAQHALTSIGRNAAQAVELFIPTPGRLPSNVAAQLPELTGFRQRAFSELVTSVVQFLIAHELSHVILRHLDEERTTIETLESLVGSDDAASVYSFQQEMDADLEALRILEKLDYSTEEARYYGPLIFGDLQDFLLGADHAVRDRPRQPSPSHPHPVLRRTAAIGSHHPDSINAELPRCVALLRAMDDLHDRTRFTSDQDAGAWIKRRALRADGETIDALTGGDANPRVNGVRFLDESAIDDYVARNIDDAIDAASRLFVIVFGASWVLNAHYQLNFAVVAKALLTIYPVAHYPKAAEFESMLRRAFPDLDDLMELADVAAIATQPPDVSG